MIRKHYMATAAGLILSLTAGSALSLSAQDKASAMADSTFVQKAASGGLMEVKLGELAQKNGNHGDVKQFGQRMATDHTKANEQLAAAAKKDGLTVPTTIAPKHQEKIDSLTALSGEAFDKAYMTLMLKDHTEDIRKFQQEADSGRAENVRKVASATLPTLQEHLKLAQQVAAKVGADTTSMGAAPVTPEE